MLFVGLTGGIAAGKSTVLGLLEELGIPTFSADQAVHDTYEDPEVISELVERLGDGILKDGVVDRDAVAGEVFSDAAARSWLEQTIWPHVGRRILNFREHWSTADRPPPFVVVEVPLLFESGMDQAFDLTVAVIAEQATRFDRAEDRGDVEVEAREERQMPIAEKAERADFVIVNDGSLEQLRESVAELSSKIRAAR
jgi:dephospho-CoA kinase